MQKKQEQTGTYPEERDAKQSLRQTAAQMLMENRGLICYIIRPIVKDENLVDDCFSAVSEIVLSKYAQYDPDKGSLTAWLTRVARNGALNFSKSRGQQMLAGSEPAEDFLENHTENRKEAGEPEELLIRRENLQELQTALQRLKDSEKKLILRKYYYMQPVSQIAAETGMSLRAAEGKLYRIKKKLLADIQRQRKGGGDHD